MKFQLNNMLSPRWELPLGRAEQFPFLHTLSTRFSIRVGRPSLTSLSPIGGAARQLRSSVKVAQSQKLLKLSRRCFDA